ncbi:sensor domain-containing diguanylate cyclase [Maridesulfovibrio sp. FT414]|uniref:sensor domain-containing diguanylate cyclase n=1 Tax=Maridesulfovibrio sp. FT414 TaxID=2979469 RepID=UPI003D809F32
MSVRLKMITVLTMILVGAFISLSLYNYSESRKSIRNEIVNSSLPLTRDNIYSEIQSGLMRPLFVSSLMANDTFLKDWTVSGEKDLSKIERYLSEIQEQYGFFSAFFVSAKTGKYYYPGGVLKTISKDDSHDVWFYDFVASGEDHAFDVDTNEAAQNVLTIFINHRLVGDDGELLGVTGVGLKMDNVARLLKSFSEKYGKVIFLIDGMGLVQVHHNIGLVEEINIRNMPGLGRIATQVLNTSAEPRVYEFETGGEKVHLTARYIPELEWILVVEQNEAPLLNSARENFIRTVVVGGIATLFIVLLSVLVINHFQLRLERLAETDELTGLGNRRAFEARVDSAIVQFEKNARPFSVVLLDLDGFKQVNDVFGHVEGDNVLRRIASVLGNSVRESDFCARWGGDEFIILVDGDINLAVSISERIREAVVGCDRCVPDSAGDSPGERVTVSCGAAQYSDGDTLDSLTGRADAAMYRSKESGKNRVLEG